MNLSFFFKLYFVYLFIFFFAFYAKIQDGWENDFGKSRQ